LKRRCVIIFSGLIFHDVKIEDQALVVEALYAAKVILIGMRGNETTTNRVGSGDDSLDVPSIVEHGQAAIFLLVRSRKERRMTRVTPGGRWAATARLTLLRREVDQMC
jgi:hypothetical protein